MTARRFPKVRSSALVVGVALSVAALAGCGSDDDDVSPEEAFCAAGDSLESDVSSLASLDPTDGTDALNESVDAIKADLNALQESGSDVASDEIDALQSSIDELDDAVDVMITGDIPVDNATTISTAIRNIGTSASALYETLSTTCS